MFNCWNRQPLNDDFSPAEVSGKRVLIVIFFGNNRKSDHLPIIKVIELHGLIHLDFNAPLFVHYGPP